MKGTAGRPAAVVLNMHGTGLGIARNLGRQGIRVIGVSTRADAPGAASRYCEHRVGPDSAEAPERLLEFLLDLGRREAQGAVLFPTRDADVVFVDRHRAALEEAFAIPQPAHEVLETILDKDRLATVAKAQGVDTPVTVRVSSSADLGRVPALMPFPVVVKPVYAHQWRLPAVWEAVGRRKGIRADTPEALGGAYARVAPHTPEVLVQEWITGEEDQFFVLGAYVDRTGRVRGSVTAQKRLQYPPQFGLGCLVRSVRNDEVRRIGTQLLEGLGFTGIAEVEFKRDARSGRYRLVEVNPRHWDQHTLAAACGVNLTHLAYRDLTGGLDGEPDEAADPGGTWVNGGGLIGLVKDDLRHGRVDLAKVATLVPAGRRVFNLWAWDDPAPFVRRLIGAFS